MTKEVERVYWGRYKDLCLKDVWNLPLQEDLCRESIRFQLETEIDDPEDTKLHYKFTTRKTFFIFQEILARIDEPRRIAWMDETYEDVFDYTPDGRGGIFATASNDTADVSLEYDLDDTLVVDYLDEHMHGQITIYEASKRSAAGYDAVRALIKGDIQ